MWEEYGADSRQSKSYTDSVFLFFECRIVGTMPIVQIGLIAIAMITAFGSAVARILRA